MPISEAELRKDEPKVAWYKSAAFIVPVIVVLVMVTVFEFLTRASEPEWQPYSMDVFERVEMNVYDIDAAEKDPTYIARWRSVEVGKYEYETLSHVANHDPHLRTFINKAMADGKVTRGEFQDIQIENDNQWSRYNKRELEQTKQHLVEVAQK